MLISERSPYLTNKRYCGNKWPDNRRNNRVFAISQKTIRFLFFITISFKHHSQCSTLHLQLVSTIICGKTHLDITPTQCLRNYLGSTDTLMVFICRIFISSSLLGCSPKEARYTCAMEINLTVSRKP